MENFDFLYFVTVVGTFAFAISGALLGVRKRMDIYGMFILAFATAVGGGGMRDVLIGRIPPFFFTDGMYILVSLLSAILVAFMVKTVERNMWLLNVSDAIGLGLFTCVGANVAIMYGIKWYGVVILGTMTATGGGMIRDVLAQDVPFVLRKEIYASASIIGSFIFLALHSWGIGLDTNLLVSSLCTVFIRLISMHYNLELPQNFDKQDT